MTPRKYIKEISHAAAQLFEGLNYYHKQLQSVEIPVFTTNYDDEAEFQRKQKKWLTQNRSRLKTMIRMSKSTLVTPYRKLYYVEQFCKLHSPE